MHHVLVIHLTPIASFFGEQSYCLLETLDHKSYRYCDVVESVVSTVRCLSSGCRHMGAPSPRASK